MAEGIEATLDALVTKLEQNLPAKLDALTTEYGDGITLDHPYQILPAVDPSPGGWPTVMVLPVLTEPTDDLGGLVLSESTVQVWTWVADVHVPTLAKRCLRYTRAVREVVMANRRPGALGSSAGYGLQWVRDQYSAVFRPEGEGYDGKVEQLTRCVFKVQQQQQY